jgi:hypothetical protein
MGDVGPVIAVKTTTDHPVSSPDPLRRESIGGSGEGDERKWDRHA